jgi:hypothetical protein
MANQQSAGKDRKVHGPQLLNLSSAGPSQAVSRRLRSSTMLVFFFPFTLIPLRTPPQSASLRQFMHCRTLFHKQPLSSSIVKYISAVTKADRIKLLVSMLCSTPVRLSAYQEPSMKPCTSILRRDPDDLPIGRHATPFRHQTLEQKSAMCIRGCCCLREDYHRH